MFMGLLRRHKHKLIQDLGIQPRKIVCRMRLSFCDKRFLVEEIAKVLDISNNIVLTILYICFAQDNFPFGSHNLSDEEIGTQSTSN